MSYKDLLKQYTEDERVRCTLQWIGSILAAYPDSETIKKVSYHPLNPYLPTGTTSLFRFFASENWGIVMATLRKETNSQPAFSPGRLGEIIAWEEQKICDLEKNLSAPTRLISHNCCNAELLITGERGWKGNGISKPGVTELRELATSVLLSLAWDILHQDMLIAYLQEDSRTKNHEDRMRVLHHGKWRKHYRKVYAQ